jgi:hypothetical protein
VVLVFTQRSVHTTVNATDSLWRSATHTGHLTHLQLRPTVLLRFCLHGVQLSFRISFPIYCLPFLVRVFLTSSRVGGRRAQIAGCGIDRRHRVSLGHAHEQEAELVEDHLDRPHCALGALGHELLLELLLQLSLLHLTLLRNFFAQRGLGL